jgi:signal transduction histidine kinase
MAGPPVWLTRGWLRLRTQPTLADVLVAVGLFGAEAVLIALAPPALRPEVVPVALLNSALCVIPVALRRRAPWLAVGLSVAGLLIPATLSYTPLTQAAGFLIVTYSVAARLPARRAVLAWLALWLPVFAINLGIRQAAAAAGLTAGFLALYNLLLSLVAFFAGRTVHARRTSTRALEERALAAEANQRALAEQAVADERRRIARELHDVVAHHVSVMGVLATGARRVLPRRPEAADEVLGTIEDTSRTTLRELRRLLDVLRTEAEPAADLTPQPDLAGIGVLVEQVRDAGLPVVLRVDGEPRGLDPGVALTVYRIAQEALTNALKHAGPATAEVRLRFGVYWLTVEVNDTGRGPAPGRTAVGHGLVGMRERVTLYGGMLRTGPRPGGGYRVYAKIPVEQLGAGTAAEPVEEAR